MSRSVQLSLGLLVLVLSSPVRADDCPDPSACIADYLALPARMPAAFRLDPPLTSAAVDAQVEALDSAAPRADPLAPAELGTEIERALGFGYLRLALAGRAIEVSATPRSRAPGQAYEERALVFHDPLVGSFEAILLVPDGQGPFPAVLALHGHGDRAETFRDLHHGPDYPARGIALLMLTQRGMNIDLHEHRAAQALMAHGLHLIGVHAYEALRALAYLRGMPTIDAQHTGLIGHSGGSSLGNLLVRLEPGLAAYISDHEVDYRSSGWREPYHCETVPGLYPLHRLLNDLSTATPTVLRVRYAYGRRKWFGLERRESRRILHFFVEHLR